MSDVLDFSTADLPAKDRFRSWIQVSGLAATTPDEDRFQGRFRAGAIGRVQIFRVAANRHRVNSDPQCADASRRDAYKLLFQEAGVLRLEQDGRSLDLTAGQWCVYDKARPYVTHSSDGCRQLGLLIPRGLLASSWFDVDPHMMAALPASMGLGRVLHESARAAIGAIGAISDRGGEGLGDALCDLVRLALLEHGEAGGRRSTIMDLKDRVRAYVERNLDDPDLSVTNIARAMGCSKRYVHKAFNGGDATLAKMIWDLRLDRCRRELQRSDIPAVSITEICYTWGFNDSHHFSRLFKKRFGIAPRDFRKGRAADAAIC